MAMNKAFIVVAVAALLSGATFAQKQTKPWKEWNKKEAEKILSESAWSRTQTETESSQSSDVSTNFGDTRGREEAVRSNTSGGGSAGVIFHVRFFTARPVRQAYVRMLELDETPREPAAVEKMDAWANLPADDRIIVAISYNGDQRSSGRVALTFRNATTADMKNSVYLERADGKRVLLTDYAPPAKDVFGARFTFPRTVDSQPFLTPDAGTIRFHAEFEPKIPDAANVTQSSSRQSSTANRPAGPYKVKLDMKFKVGEMIYNGELEY
jgi:hypothetical protein